MKKRLAKKIRKAWVLWFERLQESGGYWDTDGTWCCTPKRFPFMTATGYPESAHRLLPYTFDQVANALASSRYPEGEEFRAGVDPDKRVGWPVYDMVVFDLMRKWETFWRKQPRQAKHWRYRDRYWVQTWWMKHDTQNPWLRT